MLIIAHRGNLEGPNPAENRPDYIQKALDAQFMVEVDVWGGPNYYASKPKVHLGHSAPTYEVPASFLNKEGLFVHCKDIEALHWCKVLNVKHYFFHDKDKAVLTSSGYFWTYPDPETTLTEYSIPVIFSKKTIWKHDELRQVAGICTDYAVHHDTVFNHSAV